MSVSSVGQQSFHRILEDLSEPVVVFDLDGQVLFANAVAKPVLACLGGPAGDRPFGAFGTDGPFDAASPFGFPGPLASASPFGFPPPDASSEFRFQKEDGTTRVSRIRLAETLWEGRPAWVATLQDVTYQTQVRQQIEAFLRHCPALIYVRDREGRYTLVNDRFASSVGRGVPEVLGQTDARLYSEPLAQRFHENHQRVVGGLETPPFEIVTVQHDGEHTYLCYEFPLRDAAGGIHAVAGIRTEISEHNRAEEDLHKSEVRRQAILEASQDCVVVMDASERILEFNRAAERTFGYRRDEVLQRPLADMILPPALREWFRSNLKRYLEPGCEYMFDRRVEATAMRKGGEVFPVETAISVARHGGEPIFSAVLHDITRRKRDQLDLLQQTKYLEHAVEALERVRERERQVLAAIPSIFIGLDDSGLVTHWNPVAEKQFGLPVEQVIGKHFGSLEIGWPKERIEEAITRCSRLDEAVRFEELRLSDAQGRERILALTINRTESRGNFDCGVVLVGTDITDHKAMQAQLMLAQKMESIGQLAAGIAHEINTPTQYVNDNTRFLRDAFGDFQKLLERHQQLLDIAREGAVPAEMIEEIDRLATEVDLNFLIAEIPTAIEQSIEGLNRVGMIVRAMKQFSHPDQDEPELTDLNKAIENTVTVARNEWKYVAEVELDLDPQLPAVPCHAGRFNQVVLNLIVNAAQAIAEVAKDGDGPLGKIRIATLRAGEQVEIRVVDSGPGVPDAIRDRIFDPFFTTKQVGKGTGQGLAIAHNIIVEQHGGSIEIVSEAGKGATFVLRLPLQVPQPAEGNT